MKKISLLLICFPLLTIGQNRGIYFESNFSWHQILEKAKVEKKFVFVDCYATWCKPCKMMDSIYMLQEVGDHMNSRFVSVKMQMDTSKFDNEQVQQRYADAHYIMQKYDIKVFPTFLFFSPDGKIVHIGTGFKNADDIISLAMDGCNPGKQFYTLLNKYQRGEKDCDVMPYLAKTAKAINEEEIANAIGRNYIDNCLYKLNDDSLIKKDRIEFMISFIDIVKPNERFFRLCYDSGYRVDESIGKGTALNIINYLIIKKEIDPALAIAKRKNYSPNWEKISRRLSRKYQLNYVEQSLIAAKIGWYLGKKDWPKYTKYSIMKIEKYGVDSTSWIGDFTLNFVAYGVIFLHSNDPNEISTGIKWMEGVIKRSPNSPARLDTYANLLYKAGRKDEAIEIEEKAYNLEPQNNDIRQSLDKMKRGETTWPELVCVF